MIRTEKQKAYEKQWKIDNKEKHRASCKRYEQKHKEKSRLKCAIRRAMKRLRTPKWLTRSDRIEMNWAYRTATNISREAGIRYVVDHIIPLQGKNISGLHCPQNLQIITRSINSSKSNNY